MSVVHSLPAELSIYTVGELHPQWLTWLTASEGTGIDNAQDDEVLSVDASGVGEVDAAGIQLLLSLANALTLRHRTLQCINPSSTLISACEALGLAHLISHGADQ